LWTNKRLGGPTAAVIAYHNPHVQVTVVDLNEQRVRAWNSAHLPIHEDGLLNVVRAARDGTLDSGRKKGRQPNLFICVNTPTKTHGLGAGAMADLSAVESAARSVAQHARDGAIIVEKSTVPCGTARMIQDIVSTY
jgi:UDPglucose 6-dehydrogenase